MDQKDPRLAAGASARGRAAEGGWWMADKAGVAMERGRWRKRAQATRGGPETRVLKSQSDVAEQHLASIMPSMLTYRNTAGFARLLDSSIVTHTSPWHHHMIYGVHCYETMGGDDNGCVPGRGSWMHNVTVPAQLERWDFIQTTPAELVYAICAFGACCLRSCQVDRRSGLPKGRGGRAPTLCSS